MRANDKLVIARYSRAILANNLLVSHISKSKNMETCKIQKQSSVVVL